MKSKINYTNLILSFFLIILAILLIFRSNDLFLQIEVLSNIPNQLNDFITTFRSIVVQSIPFIFLGTAISVIVALYVDGNFIKKFMPKNKFLSHIFVALLGVFMPVCECGNIPVAKRMIFKGFSVSQAFTFMLAAPIINPVTILSTYEAFKSIYPSDFLMPAMRVGFGFTVALTIGLLLNLRKNQLAMLTDSFYKEVCEVKDHEDKRSIRRALDIFQQEFLSVFFSLTIGALIAGLLQVFVPSGLLLNIGFGLLIGFIGLVISFILFRLNKKKLSRLVIILSTIMGALLSVLLPAELILQIDASTLISIIVMISISFLISVCSSVDAFIAIGYLNYPAGSLLSFLIFGPMIDIKLLTIMRNSFKAETLWFVSITVTLLSILAGLLVNLFVF
jgi:uncharacterized membrane protein YraQ (UPF0718 family)